MHFNPFKNISKFYDTNFQHTFFSKSSKVCSLIRIYKTMFNVKILRFLLWYIPRWYIFLTRHGKVEGLIAKGMLKHLPFGKHGFFFGDKENVLRFCYKKKKIEDWGKRRNLQNSNSFQEYITSIPCIYMHIHPLKVISTPLLVSVVV